MNQQCKVCGEPAAGFHFGAFTCEGCKSFFGRTYNNLSSISECKNNGECVINKKNRTACKACRLRKCLLVGMSKSGSRYGRRSNWFKIHCLLQEQQQQKNNSNGNNNNSSSTNNSSILQNGFLSSHFLTSLCNNNNNNSNKKDSMKRISSPSDSGASSADIEETVSNRGDSSLDTSSLDNMKTSDKINNNENNNINFLNYNKNRTKSQTSETFRPGIGIEPMSPYMPTNYRSLEQSFFPMPFTIPSHLTATISPSPLIAIPSPAAKSLQKQVNIIMNNNNNNSNNNNININNNNNSNKNNNLTNNNHPHHRNSPMGDNKEVSITAIEADEQYEPIDLSMKPTGNATTVTTIAANKQAQIRVTTASPILDVAKPVPLDLTFVRSKSLSG